MKTDRSTRRAGAALAVLLLTTAARAQSGLPTWISLSDGMPQPVESVNQNSIAANKLLVWHKNGPDRPPVLAYVSWVRVNGEQGSMVTWDGREWELYPLVPGAGDFGRSITFDFDGPGPQHETVVALRTGDPAGEKVVYWNGSAWEVLPGWTEPASSQLFGDLTSFDPDGDGPLNPVLVGASHSVRAWNGMGWTNLGDVAGASAFRATSLRSYDHDGSGPALPNLYMGGMFTSVAGVPATNFARWDGSSWSGVPGAANVVAPGAMSVHDIDGPGPLPAELIVPGARTGAWNGSTWRSLGSGAFADQTTSLPVNSVSVEGMGLVTQLLFFGAFNSYDGSPIPRVGVYNRLLDSYFPMNTFGGAGFDQNCVTSMVVADLDADGPLPASIFAAGTFTSSAGRPLATLARWNGREWQTITGSFNRGVRSVQAIDLDGPGPAPEKTYILGSFENFGGALYGGIATFDSAHVSPMGAGIDPSGVHFGGNILPFDPDGDGPLPSSLVASGYFVHRWNGSAWQNLWSGNPLAYRTYRICLHDFDGPGPLPARLLAATEHSSGLGLFIQYDGTNWSSIGDPDVFSSAASGRFVLSHDHDADGPQLPVLYAFGAMSEVGGAPINSAAFFDGKAWRPMGNGWGINTPVAAVAFDPDGDGPRAVEIIAAGSLSSPEPGVARGVSAWNGVEWIEMGRINGPASALATFDPDGDGPQPLRLVAGGLFTRSNGGPILNRIAQWNTQTQDWEPLVLGGIGASLRVNGLGVEHPFGPSGPQRLVVAGEFQSVEGIPASRLARFTHHGAAWFVDQPEAQSIDAGQTISLTAGVSAGYAGATFQWYRDGVALVDGPSGASTGGGFVAGATGLVTECDASSTLTITGAQISDTGFYELLVTNDAGATASAAAHVVVGSSCPADFNADGALTSQDFFDFLNAFFTGAPSADFNLDSVVNSQDFFNFLGAFFSGC